MIDENQSKLTDEEVAAAEEQIFEHTKRIEFYLTEYSIELLAQKMQKGDFEIPGLPARVHMGTRAQIPVH